MDIVSLQRGLATALGVSSWKYVECLSYAFFACFVIIWFVKVALRFFEMRADNFSVLLFVWAIFVLVILFLSEKYIASSYSQIQLWLTSWTWSVLGVSNEIRGRVLNKIMGWLALLSGLALVTYVCQVVGIHQSRYLISPFLSIYYLLLESCIQDINWGFR